MAETLEALIARQRAAKTPAPTAPAAPPPEAPAPRTTVTATATPTASTPKPKPRPKAPEFEALPEGGFAEVLGSTGPAPAPTPGPPPAARNPLKDAPAPERVPGRAVASPLGLTALALFDDTSPEKIREDVKEGAKTAETLGTLAAPAAARLQRVTGTSPVGMVPGGPALVVALADANLAAKAEEARREATAKLREQEAAAKSDPNLAATLALANTLRMQPPREATQKFIERRATQILNSRREADPSLASNGTAFMEAQRAAGEQALDELVRLSVSRDLPWVVSPDYLDPEKAEPGLRSFLSALGPKIELLPGGNTARTESAAMWFLNAPISLTDYVVTSALQGIGGDVQSRDFSTRLLDNIQDRRDIVTAMIEGDPDLAADLSSGDGERVSKALMRLGPFAGLLIATPDPVSAAAGVVEATKVSRSILRNAPELAADFKAAPSAAEKVRVIEQAGARAREADKARVQAVARAGRYDEAERVAKAYQDTGNLEMALADASPELRTVINNEFAAVLRADPEVAAYLRSFDRETGNVDPRTVPDVAFGPDEAARLDALRAQDKDLAKQQASAPDNEGREAAKAARVPVRAEMQQLEALEYAKRGREKFAEHYRKSAELVVQRALDLTRGDDAPTVRQSGVAPRPEPPAPEDVDTSTAAMMFGLDAEAPAARRIADARTPEDLRNALRSAPDSVREMVAVNLGFDNYEDLRTVLGYDPAEQANALALAKARVEDQTKAVAEANARLEELQRVKPEDYEAYTAAKEAAQAAERDLAAARRDLDRTGSVDISGRSKVADLEARLNKQVADLEAAVASGARTAEQVAAYRKAQEALDAAKSALADAERELAKVGAFNIAGLRKLRDLEASLAKKLADAEASLNKKVATAEEAVDRARRAATDAEDADLRARRRALDTAQEAERALASRVVDLERALDDLPEPVLALYRAAEEAQAAVPKAKAAKAPAAPATPKEVLDAEAKVTDAEKKLASVRAYYDQQQAAGARNAKYLEAGVRKQEKALADAQAALDAARKAAKPKKAKPRAPEAPPPEVIAAQTRADELLVKAREAEYAYKVRVKQSIELDRKRLGNARKTVEKRASEFKLEQERIEIRNRALGGKPLSPEKKKRIADAEQALDEARAIRDGRLDALRQENDARLTAARQEHEAAVAQANAKFDEAARRYEAAVRAHDDAVRQYGGVPQPKSRATRADLIDRVQKARKERDERIAQARAEQVAKEREQSGKFEEALAQVSAAERAFEEADRAFAAVPKPAARPPQGALGAERVRIAEERARTAKQRLAELEALARSVEEAPQQRAGLEAALAARSQDFAQAADELAAAKAAEEAAAKAARAPDPGDPVILLASDLETLEAKLDMLTRVGRRNARGYFGTWLSHVGRFISQHIWRPWGEVEEASLTEASIIARRQFEGEAETIGAKLARVFTTADETTDAPLVDALNAVTSEVEPFRQSILAQQVPAEFYALVAGAHLRPDIALSEDRARRLALEVVEWAKTENPTMLDLRERMRTVSELVVDGRKDLMRPAQAGDVYLSYGVGLGGAARRVQAERVGVFVSEADQIAIKAVFEEPMFSGGGGNPLAARGLDLLIKGVSDPLAYPVGGVFDARLGLRPEEVEPYVPAFARQQTPAPRAGTTTPAVDALLNVLRVQAQDIYTPRAVRDSFQRLADAAIATLRLTDQVGPTDAMLNFWKQEAILGVGLSRPHQGWMDFLGNLMQIGSSPKGGPLLAARVGAQSLGAQLLLTQGAAQLARLADWARDTLAARRGGARVAPGTTAEDVADMLGRASLARDVQVALDGVGTTSYGAKAADELRAMREGGVLENYVTAQLPRTIASVGTARPPAALRVAQGVALGTGAGLAFGGPLGAAVGALGGAIFGATRGGQRLMEANKDALLTMVNVAANRQRAALYVALRSRGLDARTAARTTTDLVGDFARELSPFLRSTIAQVYPFLTYRKFNLRRTAQLLANPFWMKALNTAQEQGTMAADAVFNAIFVDEDEYGFHTGATGFEPDPFEKEKLYQRLRAEREARGEPLDFIEQDVERLSADLPRASERYERVKAWLDTLDPREAREVVVTQELPARVLAQLEALPPESEAAQRIRDEWEAHINDLAPLVAPYWAPDPVRAGLPEWAQDRYYLKLAKMRRQAVQGYYLQGEGRYERSGDEFRYLLTPPDPNADGLATLLLAITLPYAMSTPGSTTGGQELLGIAARDPLLSSLLTVSGLVNPDETVPVALPESAGRNLLVLNDVFGKPVVTPKNRNLQGIDPADPGADPTERTFYMDGRFAAQMSLVPWISFGLLSALDVKRTAANLAGGEGFRGEPDAVDRFGAYSWFVLGNQSKLRYASPSFEASLAEKARDERVEAKVKALGSQAPIADAPGQAALRTATGPDVNEQAIQEALERVRSGDGVLRTDIPFLRAYLLRTLPEQQVGTMSDVQVLQAVKKSL